jgi:Tfp pilus assembly protein PilF
MYGKNLRENQFWKAYRFWYPDGARQYLREQISSAAPAAEANARAQAIEAGAGAGSAQFFFTTDATVTTAWDSTVEANLLINNDGEFAAAASQEELQDAASAADILVRDTTDNVVSSTDVVTEMSTGFEKCWTQEQAGGAGADTGAGAGDKITNDTKKKGTHCGKCSKRMKRENLCSRCTVINYCSRKCQKADWKAHRPRCDKYRAENAADEARRSAAAAAPLTKAAHAIENQRSASFAGGPKEIGAAAVDTVDAVGAVDALDADDGICAVCLDELSNPRDKKKLPCSHEFHRSCLDSWRKFSANKDCPGCRAPLPPGAEELFDRAVMLLVRLERGIFDKVLRERLVEETEVLFREALLEDPKHAHAHACLAFMLNKHTQDFDDAEAEYRLAIECDPQDAKAHYNLGALLMDHAQDHAGAEAEYRAAIKCDPKHAGAHCNLGVLLENYMQDYDGAEAEYRAAIECDTKHVAAHNNLGVLLDNHKQDHAGAEAEYRAAIECDTKLAGAHSNLGILLMDHTQDHVGAEAEYRAAIECDPKHAGAHSNLGVLLENYKQDHVGAEAEYRAAIECDPKNADVHYNLGVLLENYMQDFGGAETEYRARPEACRCTLQPRDTAAEPQA